MGSEFLWAGEAHRKPALKKVGWLIGWRNTHAQHAERVDAHYQALDHGFAGVIIDTSDTNRRRSATARKSTAPCWSRQCQTIHQTCQTVAQQHKQPQMPPQEVRKPRQNVDTMLHQPRARRENTTTCYHKTNMLPRHARQRL